MLRPPQPLQAIAGARTAMVHQLHLKAVCAQPQPQPRPQPQLRLLPQQQQTKQEHKAVHPVHRHLHPPLPPRQPQRQRHPRLNQPGKPPKYQTLPRHPKTTCKTPLVQTTLAKTAEARHHQAQGRKRNPQAPPRPTRPAATLTPVQALTAPPPCQRKVRAPRPLSAQFSVASSCCW